MVGVDIGFPRNRLDNNDIWNLLVCALVAISCSYNVYYLRILTYIRMEFSVVSNLSID